MECQCLKQCLIILDALPSAFSLGIGHIDFNISVDTSLSQVALHYGEILNIHFLKLK